MEQERVDELGERSLIEKAKERVKTDIVNPSTGEVIVEYNGPAIEAYGFLEYIETQVRNKKAALRTMFKAVAQEERDKGFITTNTFTITTTGGSGSENVMWHAFWE